MAISTQTEALIELYENKVERDQTQLVQINNTIAGYEINTGSNIVKIYGVTENLSNFNIPISGLDNQIVEINSDIYLLYQDIVGIATNANANGCPVGNENTVGISTAGISTTLGISTIYADVVSYRSYNFTFPNVFGTSTGIITTGNLGIGTQTFISQVAIGTYFEFDSGVGTCGIASAAIDSKLAQINTLISQRNPYISNVNTLKSARVKYQLEQLGYNQSVAQITGQIAESNSILNILKNSSLQEFF